MTALGRRKRILAGVAAIIVVAGVVAWQKLRLGEMAHIGAGYAAEQTCACVFISKRALASCVNDLEPLAQKVVSVRVGDGEVTASALLVGAATARYEEAFGCSLRD
jgi:hypothetical protein